ncbi:MAG: L,D-transpeptidase family protein [Peptoniphilaceae bacterium]|nr:L,D-transpeptidase family protein [Peptoniphilaceae bacterium]
MKSFKKMIIFAFIVFLTALSTNSIYSHEYNKTLNKIVQKYPDTKIETNNKKQFLIKNGKKFSGYITLENEKLFFSNGELSNWWYDDGNDWFFFKDGKKLNGYGTDGNGRKYFINGKYANGIFSNKLFKDGSVSKGFTYVNGIFYAEGTSPANWWYDDGNDWFYFKDGKKFTGLASDANGQRYFVRGKYANGLYSNKLYKNGLETHGKQYINGRYYTEDKSLAQGWYDDGNDWFFFKNGKKLNGYGTDGNGRKYFVNGKYANGTYAGNYYKNGEYVQKIYGDWYLKDNAFHSLDGNWYVTGDDFVIVSISRQKLWLVRNGEILDEMGVITGNYNLYGSTPKGVYRIQGKISPTVLKGADYASWVQYWVPFIGNTYGIHDANWQPYYAFSNPNYFRYGGSRGCINVRPDKMGYIYRNVYTGMKVIIY